MTTTALPRDSASLTRELLVLATPMIGVTLSRLLMGFIDFVMVSSLGTEAQAAVSPCTLLLYTIACVGMGIGQSVQTYVAQHEGRGEPQRAGGYVWPAMWLGVLAALLSAPIAATVADWFPVLIGRVGHHPADVQAMEIAFLRYALWAIGPMVMCAGLECFWNGVKRPEIDLVAIVISLLTLVGTNYIFIWGKFGFPALGIGGSGLATLLAWSVRLVVLAAPLLLMRGVETRYHVLRSFGLRMREMRELLGLGLPVAAQWLVDIGAWLVFMQFLMPPFGKSAMAAGNMVIQMMHLSFMPCLGIGMALTTQVGNAVGARDGALAVLRVRIARRIVLGYMGAMALLFIFGGRQLASVLTFETTAELTDEVLTLAAAMAIWAGLFQIFDGLCIIYSFASRGSGDTRVPALLFAICCWGIFILGGFVLSRAMPQLGIHALWSMATLYIMVLGVLLWYRFHMREAELSKPIVAGA